MRQRLFAVLMAAVMSVVLGGCLKTDADLYIDDQSRISGTLFLGVDPAQVDEPLRSELRGRIQQQAQTIQWPTGVQARYVESDGSVGAQLQFRNVSPDDYRAAVQRAYEAAGLTGSTYPEFARVGEQFEMRWRPSVHLADEPTALLPLSVGDSAVTFPGAVTDTNGAIPRGNGNTASWTQGDSSELRAKASATSNGAMLKPFETLVRGLLFIALMAGAGLLLWVVLWNRRGRRKKPAPAPQDEPAERQV